ncbi:MAG TPA: recombinase RecA [Anaerohalosphaeraceae bacterium]|nr:recombinase RecA [Phycisphaerae bacterium]HOL30782.1 recombinase RecA [Anaerohalosphaeraceae bacterium]HOM76644.1 recombinase RecA [Anaerohalosphaeraceae bacterium]HPC63707.1 recombinase RecA [Anaerohalosphaeraceae bacterium]HPO69812.1 recombinase RecA [Anaerohalosphaeraceae bacterium]
MAKAKQKTADKETKTVDSARSDALDRAIAQIEKQYGVGSIMKMDESQHPKIEGISTGALSLDIALGGAGIPRGRIVEFYGPESSGKTTLALHVIANAQKAGGVAAFIDAEHALDTTWAKKLGVDISGLLISQPDTGEQALDIAEMLVKSNAVDIIVIDSVAALVPAAELQGEMGQSHVGLQARLMSQALRKLTGVIAKSKCCLIFINQIRMKIGVMFGNPETTTGGNALKFYASVRVDVRRISTIKAANDEAIGNRVRARVVKNKVAPPFRAAEFDIMFDSGINYVGDLLDLAVECGLVNKSGAWFTCGDLKLGQGRDKAMQYLKDNPALLCELKDKVLANRGLIQCRDSGKEASDETSE